MSYETTSATDDAGSLKEDPRFVVKRQPGTWNDSTFGLLDRGVSRGIRLVMIVGYLFCGSSGNMLWLCFFLFLSCFVALFGSASFLCFYLFMFTRRIFPTL